MKLRVDREECAGYGICVEILPAVLALDDDGYATITRDGAVPEELVPLARRAIAECPVAAIHEATGGD